MKKFIAIITTISLLTVIVLFSFTSCKTDTNKGKNTTLPTESTEAPTEPTYNFPSLPKADEVVSWYITEIKGRTSDDKFNFTEIEAAFYRSQDFYMQDININRYHNGSVDTYYYPVMTLNNGEFTLLYTDEYGNVRSFVIGSNGGSSDHGRLHRPSSIEDFEILSACKKREVLYIDSQVKVFEYQEITATYDIPEGAVYCGQSQFEGYIFHKDDEVYALRGKDNGRISDYHELKLDRIAKGVEYVILSDYALSSDPWSQPLFKMQDGSLKAYVRWYGDENVPDDVGHLVEPVYEGGYHR